MSQCQMILYQRTHTTRPAVMVRFFGILFLVITVGFLDPAASLPVGALVATLAVVSILLAGYRSLMVTVTPAQIHLAYTLGWPNRTIDRSGIASAEPLQIPWWYGGGIRRTTKGWMWNVWGLQTVLITFSDGKRFLIGTDDPEGLIAALT